MAKPKVYFETTFVSYLTAWPSRDVVMHAFQQLTREWWQKRRGQFELCTSVLVLTEAAAGGPEAAKERLDILAPITILDASKATALTAKLLEAGALPAKAAADAAHIAIAATNGIDYLLTWNCKHLANATMRGVIEEVCRAAGYPAPIICIPDLLLGE